MCGTLAHEFGHVLGLADNYAATNHNVTYHSSVNCKKIAADDRGISESIKTNYSQMYQEFGTYDMIMHSNGYVSLNDIEMVVYAFVENKWQYYTPNCCNVSGHDGLSKAIRSRPLLYADKDKKINGEKIKYYSYN